MSNKRAPKVWESNYSQLLHNTTYHFLVRFPAPIVVIVIATLSTVHAGHRAARRNGGWRISLV